jgi:hypothetical protein
MMLQACSRSSSVSHSAHRLKRAQMQRLHSRRCSSNNTGSPAFFDFFTSLHRPPTLIVVALRACKPQHSLQVRWHAVFAVDERCSCDRAGGRGAARVCAKVELCELRHTPKADNSRMTPSVSFSCSQWPATRQPHHTSHITRHTSHVTRHTSHVTRHKSHVTSHKSHGLP